MRSTAVRILLTSSHGCGPSLATGAAAHIERSRICSRLCALAPLSPWLRKGFLGTPSCAVTRTAGSARTFSSPASCSEGAALPRLLSGSDTRCSSLLADDDAVPAACRNTVAAGACPPDVPSRVVGRGSLVVKRRGHASALRTQALHTCSRCSTQRLFTAGGQRLQGPYAYVVWRTGHLGFWLCSFS